MNPPDQAFGAVMPTRWATMSLPDRHDVIAADGSQVRVLLAMKGASTVHCTLPADAGSPPGVSNATVNVGLDEIWYFLEGEGEVWRKNEEASETVPVGPGVCLTIPAGTIFQFRNTGRGPLTFLCVTMPPWKDGSNAQVDEYRWPVGRASR
jgi:mannose-6-phosphate isomerase-like protein (cupin superfamily)